MSSKPSIGLNSGFINLTDPDQTFSYFSQDTVRSKAYYDQFHRRRFFVSQVGWYIGQPSRVALACDVLIRNFTTLITIGAFEWS